jgi:hypothetical protein
MKTGAQLLLAPAMAVACPAWSCRCSPGYGWSGRRVWCGRSPPAADRPGSPSASGNEGNPVHGPRTRHCTTKGSRTAATIEALSQAPSSAADGRLLRWCP